MYRNDIVGMDDETRERMHLLFTARWTYFHTDVFTAAKMLDSEYIKDEHTLFERKEFRNVLLKIAETPNSMGTPNDVRHWSINGGVGWFANSTGNRKPWA